MGPSPFLETVALKSFFSHLKARTNRSRVCGSTVLWPKVRVVLASCVFNTLMMSVFGPCCVAGLGSGLETGRMSVGAGRTLEKEG